MKTIRPIVPDQQLLSYAQAALLLNCSVRTIERLITRGLLQKRGYRGLSRVTRASVDSYIAGGSRE